MAGFNWKNDGKWSWSFISGWIIWIVLFFVLEFTALFDNNDATPSFTEVVTRVVPGFIVFMGIGWLIWHFVASYHEHKLLGQDDEDKNSEDKSE
jgi:hypothetical protein